MNRINHVTSIMLQNGCEEQSKSDPAEHVEPWVVSVDLQDTTKWKGITVSFFIRTLWF